MSERARAFFVIAVSALFAAAGYVFFLKPFIAQQPQVERVLHEKSTWAVTLQEYHLSGSLSAETYRVANDNGKVAMFYSATDHAGAVTKQFSVPIVGPSGTFLFEELRADGIWDLDDKALRPKPIEEYVVEVQQTLGNEGGSRAFSFSDPRYWATTNALEYRLRLSGKISGDVAARTAGETGKPLRDDRYLKIVQLFEAFGPQSVLDAENKIRAELAAGAGNSRSSTHIRPR